MAKSKVCNVSYDMNYSSRDDNHDTIRDIRMNFDNPDEETLMENLNCWLSAVGVNLQVVSK